MCSKKFIINILIFFLLIPQVNCMQKSDSLEIPKTPLFTMTKSKSTEDLPGSNYVFYVIDRDGNFSKISPGKNLIVFYKDYKSCLKYNKSKKRYYKNSKVYVSPRVVIICEDTDKNVYSEKLPFYELAFLDAQKIINLTKENLDQAKTINSENVLLNAIIYQNTDLFKKILELDDITFTITDNNKNNLLHYAVKYCFNNNLYEIIKTLISKGCDIKAKNKDKKTAYDLAIEFNKTIEDIKPISKKVLKLLNPKNSNTKPKKN